MKTRERASSIYEDLRLIAALIERGERVEFGDFSSEKQAQLAETIAAAPGGTMTLRPLTALIGTTRQNVRKLAEGLAKKGYVALTKDEADGRSLRLTLTADGHDALRRVRGAALIDPETLFIDFDEKTLKLIAKSIARVRKRLQRQLENPDSQRTA